VTLRGVMTPGTVGVMTPNEKAPRCILAGAVVLVPREIWPHQDTERHLCHQCGQMVRFRARATDLPGIARLLPHRTDGTPCR
jgi:hypothetical protein